MESSRQIVLSDCRCIAEIRQDVTKALPESGKGGRSFVGVHKESRKMFFFEKNVNVFQINKFSFYCFGKYFPLMYQTPKNRVNIF